VFWDAVGLCGFFDGLRGIGVFFGFRFFGCFVELLCNFVGLFVGVIGGCAFCVVFSLW